LAQGGEVFVLDMGEPVRIVALAQAMIELSGLSLRSSENPDGDIEIVEVGLRQGEKLHEELLIGDAPQTTRHSRILMAKEKFIRWNDLEVMVMRLGIERDRAKALDLLREIVPDFKHMRDNCPRVETSSKIGEIGEFSVNKTA
jgi:FlaA1/EpsC-like NDP-sugar epimerase